MKKSILLVFVLTLFYSNSVFAEVIPAHFSGSGSTGGTRCDSFTQIASDEGGLICTTHTYYSYSDHTISITEGEITNCPYGEIAISASGNGMVCRKYDDISPTCSGHNSPTPWTNGDVTVYASCSDTGGSGCTRTPYQIARVNSTKYFTVSDRAGNTGTCSRTITNIDKIKPSYTKILEPTDWTSDPVTLTITCSDGDSLCDSNIPAGWSNAGTYKIKKTFSTNESGNVSIGDNAGNIRSINFLISNINNGNSIYGGVIGATTLTHCENSGVPINSDTYKTLGNTIVNDINDLNNNTTCTNHNYYDNTYEKATLMNTMTMCNGEDIVVGINGVNIICKKYDDIKPECKVTNNPTNWAKPDINLEADCTDSGGSGCENNTYTQVVSNNGSVVFTVNDNAGNQNSCFGEVTKLDLEKPICGNVFIEESGWGQDRDIVMSGSYDNHSGIASSSYTCNVDVEGGSCNYNIEDHVGRTRLCTSDNAIRVDTTVPVQSDLDINLDTNNIYLANNQKQVKIIVGSNNGAPINVINTKFENFSDKDSSFDFLGTVSPFTHDINIQNIDNDRNANNYRTYKYEIEKVCDEAGNCETNFSDYDINVYASQIDKDTSSITGIDNLDVNKVANGTGNILDISLKDEYGNDILDVTNQIGTQIRKVSLSFNYSNSLNLNQLYNTGTGVIIDSEDSLFGTNTKIITRNADGDYKINFEIYAPTNNNNKFIINSFSGSVNDITGDIDLFSIVDFQFKPIYETSIIGEISTGSLFVEGFTQTGTLTVTKNGTYSTTNNGLFLVQSGSKMNYFTGSALLNNTGTGTLTDIVISGNLIGTKFLSTLGNITKKLVTLFSLNSYDNNSGVRGDIKDIQLYEYIQYTILGKPVTYLAGILNINNTQDIDKLLKIYGRTNISDAKQRDIVENQNEEDIQNLAGNITKASLKRDIIKKATQAIKFAGSENVGAPTKNITGDSWHTENGGKVLGDILYYKFTTEDNAILAADLSNTLNIKGKKTLIVKGGNVRITDNIVNYGTSDILGIIVLKDENGNGGKLYIDTGVTRVDAVIYTDKSVIGYDEYYTLGNPENLSPDDIIKHETDGNISNSALQKQLYIYGSIFSDNTIGASRLDPAVCPFWTKAETSVCNIIMAQKYDFNYLRAGYTTKYDINYGDYPVIIKYNPVVQTGPPPLFGN